MATAQVVERVYDYGIENIKQLMDNKITKAVRTRSTVRMEFEKPLGNNALNNFLNKNNFRNYFLPTDNIVEIFLD